MLFWWKIIPVYLIIQKYPPPPDPDKCQALNPHMLFFDKMNEQDKSNNQINFAA